MAAQPGKSTHPFAVSITGWTLVIGGVSTFFMIFIFKGVASSILGNLVGENVSMSWLYVTSSVTGAAYTVAGIAILRGRPWGRVLFILFEPAHIALGFIMYYNKPYAAFFNSFNILFYGIYGWLLTVKSSNAWFAGTYRETDDEEVRKLAVTALRRSQKTKSGVTQVFGILFAIASGFFFGITVLFFGFGNQNATTLMSVLSGGLAALILVPGILLWGRRRWAGVAGWTLTAAGTWAVIEGVCLVILVQTSYWKMALGQVPPQVASVFNDVAFTTIIVAGCIVIFMGISLLKYQYYRDDKTVSVELSTENMERRETGVQPQQR